jgi:hypothetical protein
MELLVILVGSVLVLLSNLSSVKSINDVDVREHSDGDGDKEKGQYHRNRDADEWDVGMPNLVQLSQYPNLDIVGVLPGSPMSIENEETERMVFGDSFGPTY